MDNNSTYEQYEQEIDLKDLMFAVLHKWRPVILVAVVLAVVLGGAKGAMTYRQQNDPEVSKETREKYQEELDLYEKNKETAEREIENLKTDIANQQEYLDKSIWINMSPYDVCESRIDMYVTTGYEIMPGMVYQNQDYTDTILQAYQGLLTSSAVMEDVAKSVGTEPRYLKELVNVTIGTNGGQLNHLLTINVKHKTKSDAKKVMDEMLDHMNELHGQVVASIGEHTVNTVNSSVSAMVDLTLADTQRAGDRAADQPEQQPGGEAEDSGRAGGAQRSSQLCDGSLKERDQVCGPGRRSGRLYGGVLYLRGLPYER